MRRSFAGFFVPLGFLFVGANVFPVAQAYAEFPPEGAVPDPDNPSVATGDLPDSSHKGTLRHYIFYFDCGKRDWIGVSVAGTAASPSSPPQAVGLGREFQPGPPLGAKMTSSNSAVTASGQSFVLEKGSWVDVRTKKPVRSPGLCPGSVPRRPAGRVTGSSQDTEGSNGDRLQPIQRRQSDPTPDQLPPPPKFMLHP